MHDTVTLIRETITTDAIGQRLAAEETRKEMLCIARSVSRSEWSAAQQNDLQAEWLLEVFHADYSGEKVAEFRGIRYAVYRTHCIGEYMELYLGTRVGEMIG